MKIYSKNPNTPMIISIDSPGKIVSDMLYFNLSNILFGQK